MPKTTSDDLDFAAEWLCEYEDTNDPTGAARMRKVAEWLRDQAAARRREAVVRVGMKETGASRKQVVTALGRIAARPCINPRAREAGWGVAFCQCPNCAAERVSRS